MKKSCLFLLLLCQCALAQPGRVPAPLAGGHSRWVDSVMARLTPDERIAQLIMVAAYSNRGPEHLRETAELVQKHKVGGLVFFQGGPVRQAQHTNFYQSLAKVPLLIAIDGEWGLAMRLDSTIAFPYQMTLGAIQDDSLVYRMGAEVARQCRRLGIHVNFAPVVDVNSNAGNPVINFRSFGADRENVARKGIMYMRGMQDNGLLTTVKHFPGHGDTDVDSHYDLPVIKKSRRQLDSLELYPFRRLIEAGADGVMVSHLNVPALDTARNLPATLSEATLAGVLRRDLGFRGLVFTDAMNMKGVTNYYAPGVTDARAILAGNDVLEFTEDVPRTIAEIRKAIREGRITQAAVDARCRNVLAAKAWAGLARYRPVALPGLVADLNPPQARLLNRRLTEAALTLLRNQDTLLPLRRLDTLRIASVSVGADRPTAFQKMLGRYAAVRHFTLSRQAAPDEVRRVKAALAGYNLVVVGLHVPSVRPARRYGITEAMPKAVAELLAAGRPAVVVHFGNAYTLPAFATAPAAALLLTYQDGTDAQELAAQAVFGAVAAAGRLPVRVQPAFSPGDGLGLQPLHRLKYTLPEEAGIRSGVLHRKIDSVVHIALAQRATPGCQVLVAKDGMVVFHKTYGHLTYDTLRPTQPDDLYDLASVTKVAASAPALMRLADEGKFSLDKTLADYLPDYRRSNKKHIPLRDILTHQARLTAWIPFWKQTVDASGRRKARLYRTDSSGRHPVRIVDNLWLRGSYARRIHKQIRKSPLLPEKKYVYSDLSYYLYPRLVQLQAGRPFEAYLKETFYGPLGAGSLTFRPLRQVPAAQIVPTEYDSLFRKAQLHGTVHDEGAALLGGLSGHAGLFGTADDLAKLMQMYLQMGEYGGRRYIAEATLREWTRYNDPAFSRRGIAFDKPDPRSPGLSAAAAAGPDSFGHSGFTGTFVWADPARRLVYVFLANRVHPTRNNNKLGTLNIRTGVQQAIYEAIGPGL